jgi:hypothetical protein
MVGITAPRYRTDGSVLVALLVFAGFLALLAGSFSR